MPEPEFNVFISYNSKDAKAVLAIAKRLRDVDELKVWLDDWEVVPGSPFQPALESGLRSSRTVAVFIGTHGFGDWQRPEMWAAIDALVKRGIRVLPVLLPGVAALPENLPMFLAGQSAVIYRSLADANAHAKLLWGITGINPMAGRPAPAVLAREPQQPIAVDPLATGVDAVASALINGDMTFLLGRLLGPGAGAPMLPSMLSMALLRDVNLVPEDYQGLLPEIESAASLLAATRGDPQMENFVLRLVGASSQSEPNAYAELADIMRLLGRRPTAQRARRRAPRLILSTNLDLHMEHALLRAGLPFTRLVHHRAGGRIDLCKFTDVVKDRSGDLRIDGQLVAVDDNSALDALINACERRSVRIQESESGLGNPLVSLDLSTAPDPILYKFQGSEDIGNSSAISTDQCYEFLSRVLRQPCVPSQITEIIGNSTLVILGSTLLDHEFRLSYHALLREALRSNPYSCYAVLNRRELDQRDFGHRHAEQSWDSVKKAALARYKVEMFDAPVAGFLGRVADKLRNEWGDT